MDFNYLRRNSLFAPPQPSTGINPNSLDITQDMADQNPAPPVANQPQQPGSPANPSLSDIYNQMMSTPSGPANQRYKDFLASNQPQRSDYKPSKMDRLGAVLGGVSAGIQHGGTAGFDAAKKVLDDPYNEAMNDYTLRAKRLEAGAGLEDKEINNRVKTYRDFVTDEYNKGRIDAQGRRIDIADKLADAKISGIETPEQKAARESSNIGLRNKGQLAAAGARSDNAFNLFSRERGPKLEDAMKLANVRSNNAATLQDRKFESIKDLKQYVADNVNPDKYDRVVGKDGFVYAINKSDPTDVTKTEIDTGKLNDEQKAALKLKNSKELKAAPGAATKTTTKKTVSGNTSTTETDRKPVDTKTETVNITLPDGRNLTIPKDQLEEAKKREPKLVVK